MGLNILHIANDYAGSKVYKKLVESLDQYGVRQSVYTAIRSASLIGNNQVQFKAAGSKIHYSFIINNLTDRIFYNSKINKIFEDCKNRILVKDINVIHAHTWFSDGGVAYRLHEQYGTPYIVAIRNTDLNIFFKYFIHLRRFGFEILEKAVKIVFISHAYLERFKSLLADDNSKLLEKCVVLVNGVDEFWIQNTDIRKPNTRRLTSKFLYVGRFTKGKNLLNLIGAVNLLKDSGHDVEISLVGSGGNAYRKVLKLVDESGPHVKYLGQIDDLHKLRETYLAHDFFTMPSEGETFGLVYVEALLNGLPILYTESEGIDGAYQGVGEKVTIGDVDDIKKCLLKLVYSKGYTIDYTLLRSNHDWRVIANKYNEIYENIIPPPVL